MQGMTFLLVFQAAEMIKDFIRGVNGPSVDITNIMQEFPDIQTSLMEKIVHDLVRNGTLKKLSNDLFQIPPAAKVNILPPLVF
jgi:hypothetical protein